MSWDLQKVLPSVHTKVATLSDDDDVPKYNGRYPVALSLSDAGNMKVIDAEGQTFTYNNGDLALGYMHPISVQRIYATDSTVTRVLLYYAP